jgi:hypothetical protein
MKLEDPKFKPSLANMVRYHLKNQKNTGRGCRSVIERLPRVNKTLAGFNSGFLCELSHFVNIGSEFICF